MRRNVYKVGNLTVVVTANEPSEEAIDNFNRLINEVAREMESEE